MLTNTTTIALPVPHRETLSSRCEYYRACGFEALVRPDLRRIYFLASSRVGAVILPSALAPQVRAKLREGGLALGPTVSHPRSGRWTVMVQPNIDNDTATFARLFRAYVSVVRTGGEIALPAPSGERTTIDRRWMNAPTTALPPGAAVVEAIQACIELSARRRLA
ncbi:DNA-directed RNA polymerase subunit beta [Nocardia asteroides]|uniref:DNA-directed RNA polymerase subunit beta n=1 Tax=Nocardia asteroides TaxID=1824 RepID=UPI0037CB4C7B